MCPSPRNISRQDYPIIRNIHRDQLLHSVRESMVRLLPLQKLRFPPNEVQSRISRLAACGVCSLSKCFDVPAQAEALEEVGLTLHDFTDDNPNFLIRHLRSDDDRRLAAIGFYPELVAQLSQVSGLQTCRTLCCLTCANKVCMTQPQARFLMAAFSTRQFVTACFSSRRQ